MKERLYLVVRADLPPGLQAVQAVHAFREFVEAHPVRERSWYRGSNCVALLSVPDEAALADLLGRAADADLMTAWFREDDLGGSLTAVALEPGARRLCKGLPPALKVTGPRAYSAA